MLQHDQLDGGQVGDPPRRGGPLKFIEPMMPTLVDQPPEGDEWLHEVKYDG